MFALTLDFGYLVSFASLSAKQFKKSIIHENEKNIIKLTKLYCAHASVIPFA